VEALSELDVFDQREVPVLLVGAAIGVAAQNAEIRGAEVGIRSALGGIEQRRRSKVGDVQIAVQAVLGTSFGVATANRSASREAAVQSWRVPGGEEARSGQRIGDRERRSRLDDGNTADGPITEHLVFPIVAVRE